LREAQRRQRPAARKPRSRRLPFWLVVGIGAVVAMFLLVVLVDSAVYYNKIHGGITVSGVDLGGRTRDEAEASLTRLVGDAQSSPITLKAGDDTWTLMPEDVGTSMDVRGAVKAAMAATRERGFFLDVGARWRLYFGNKDVPLAGRVEAAKLAAFVAGIARELDIEPVNAGLAIENGRIRVIDSVEGKVVDQSSLTKRLSDLLVTLHSTTVEVPIIAKEPAVKAEDNAEAQRQAETMISGPVTVTGGDKKWIITPEEIASYMSFKAEMKGGISTLVPFMDTGKLEPLLGEIAPAVLQKPKDASFAHDADHVWVVPGKNGKQLDADTTAEAITAATLETTGRTVKVVTKVKEPGLTTDEAKAMGIKHKLTSYTSRYAGVSERQINVELATKYATNVFLAPGEEYNFDKQVGPRTEGRGFRKAPGIVGPGKLEDVFGGGICQVSTTMFNAVAGGKAGLTIKERHNHSLYIAHYPKGRDATVTAGGKNLRFVNDMEHYVWITGTSNGVTTTITVWGTDQGRSTKWTVGDFYDVKPKTKKTVLEPAIKAGSTSLVHSGQDGKRLKTTRVVTQNGKVIHKNTWINVWPMYPQEIAVGTGTTKPTTSTTEPPTSTTEPPTTEPPTSSTTTTTGPDT
jgi:vancomycin resistance protein YoaR